MSEFKHANLIGPFVTPEYYVPVVDGYKVPNIKVVPLKGEKDGRSEVHLDGRFVYILDDAELDLVINLVANAMAVAAGYSCFGENSVKDPNPFKVKMIGI